MKFFFPYLVTAFKASQKKERLSFEFMFTYIVIELFSFKCWTSRYSILELNSKIKISISLYSVKALTNIHSEKINEQQKSGFSCEKISIRKVCVLSFCILVCSMFNDIIYKANETKTKFEQNESRYREKWHPLFSTI